MECWISFRQWMHIKYIMIMNISQKNSNNERSCKARYLPRHSTFMKRIGISKKTIKHSYEDNSLLCTSCSIKCVSDVELFYLLLFHLFPVAYIFSGYLELLNQLLVSNWFFSNKTFVTFFVRREIRSTWVFFCIRH